jgi:hypothetical protein
MSVVIRTGLGLLFACTVLGLASELQRQSHISVVARYESGDGQIAEGLGVCDISAEKMDCWDMNGKRSSDLNGLLRTRLAARYTNDLRFRYGKKNRFLVLSLVNPHGIGVNSRFKEQWSMLLYSPWRPNLCLIGTTPDEKAETDSVEVSISEAPKKPLLEILFEKGRARRRMASTSKLALGLSHPRPAPRDSHRYSSRM